MRYQEAVSVESNLRGVYRGQSISGHTGIMEPGLPAGSAVVAMSYPPTAKLKFVLTTLHLHYTCLESFLEPVFAGRRLASRRGVGALNPTGGVPLDVGRNDSAAESEVLVTGQIATTGALDLGPHRYEQPIRRRFMVAHAGTKGMDYDEVWVWKDGLLLRPGQFASIVAPMDFDAGGAWQLGVSASGFEV